MRQSKLLADRTHLTHNAHVRRTESQKIEDKLEALRSLASSDDRALQNEKLAQALADPHARVVAKAAALCEERLLHERITDLKAAYARFLEDPIKRDPKCMAKQAIARALVSLECADVAFFLAGIRYRQLEPTWGGSTDTAMDIRCSCAMGLVASGHFQALVELTELLNDKEARAREGAVRAISCGSPQAAEVLLRFKVKVGDPEPEVIGECFTGLMSIAPDDSLSFVGNYLLDRDDAIRDLAALSLGQSRHPGALEHLRSAWNHRLVTPEFRKVLIRAAAVHRTDAAFDWLLSIIEQDEKSYADTAVEALAVYERNTKLAERVKQALQKRMQNLRKERTAP